jgi:hypothetical protein
MADTRYEIIKQIKKHLNEPILITFDVGRLVGFAEDSRDYYYIIKQPAYPNGKILYSSCVGGFTSLRKLKNQNKVITETGEIWDDYSRLDDILTMNGASKVDEIMMSVLDDSIYNN